MKDYKIRFSFSKQLLEINFSKWRTKGNQVLLITGLVGSGKTSLGKQYAKKYNAKLISFDALKFYDNSNLDSKKEVDEFTGLYPNIIPLIKTNWYETDKTNTNDILYKKYCVLFYDFIIKKYNGTDIPVILEGIQMFVRLSIDKCISMPCLILRTSALKCCKRYIYRDFISMKRRINIDLLKQIYIYHVQQPHMLNKFIKHML